MPVRVRLKIKGRSREKLTSALANSGFESDVPQLIIPMKLAEELGISSTEAYMEGFNIAGGGKAFG